MTNKILIFFLVSLLLTSFSLGCIFPESENNSSEIQKNISDVSGNVESSVSMPAPVSLAQVVQVSGILVEATIVDIEMEQITLNDWMGRPYEQQYMYLTLRVNEILKSDQDIEIGEEIIEKIPTTQGVNSFFKNGGHIIFIKKGEDVRVSPLYVFLPQEGEIYSNADYQISLEDLRTLAQQSDDYYEKYIRAFKSEDIVVAEMLTNTDVNQMEYNRQYVLPHQIHKIKIIDSVSGKITGNIELDYEMLYFPEKILKENNLSESIFTDQEWIKTSDGYYHSELWDPNSSFLKKGDYYIIYVRNHSKNISTNDIAYIEKYDLAAQKEFVEEYQEIYELIEKYEKRVDNSF